MLYHRTILPLIASVVFFLMYSMKCASISLDQQLADAAMNGDFEAVKEAIGKGASISWYGFRCFRLAATKSHLEIINYFLERGEIPPHIYQILYNRNLWKNRCLLYDVNLSLELLKDRILFPKIDYEAMRLLVCLIKSENEHGLEVVATLDIFSPDPDAFESAMTEYVKRKYHFLVGIAKATRYGGMAVKRFLQFFDEIAIKVTFKLLVREHFVLLDPFDYEHFLGTLEAYQIVQIVQVLMETSFVGRFSRGMPQPEFVEALLKNEKIQGKLEVDSLLHEAIKNHNVHAIKYLLRFDGANPAANDSRLILDIISQERVNVKILSLLLEDGRVDPKKQLDTCLNSLLPNSYSPPNNSKLKALVRLMKDDRVNIKIREIILTKAIDEEALLKWALDKNKLSTIVSLTQVGIVKNELFQDPNILVFAAKTGCLVTIQYILKNCTVREFPRDILSQATTCYPEVHEILLDDERVDPAVSLERFSQFIPLIQRVYFSHPRVSGEFCCRYSSLKILSFCSPCYLQAAISPKGISILKLWDGRGLELDDIDLLRGRARLVPENQKYFHSLRIKLMKLPNHIMSSKIMAEIIDQLYCMQTDRLKRVLKYLVRLRPVIESSDPPIPSDIFLHLSCFL